MKFTNRIVVIVLFFTILLALIVAFFMSSHENKKIYPTTSKVCSLSTCREESLRLWNAANISIDPCENFYAHACGKLIREYKKNNYESISQLSVLQKKINESLQSFLASPSAPGDTIPVKTIKLFYRKCNDKSEDKVRSILKYIKSLGGWPLIDIENIEKDTDLQLYNTIVRLKAAKIDFDIPFEIMKNAATDTIQIRPVKTLIRKKLLKEKGMGNFFQEITEIANFLGGDSESINKELNRMYDLELLMQKPSESYDNKGQVYSVDELVYDFPGINWKLLLDRITPNQTLVLYDIFQTKNISHLMATHKKSFINYLIWYLISPYMKFISYEREFRVTYKYNNLSNAQVLIQRTKACYHLTFETIGFNALYANNYVGKSKNEIQKMYSMIRMEAEKFLESAPRKDESTLDAISKLKNLESMIGYPGYLMYKNLINTYYNFIPHKHSSSFNIYVDIRRADQKIKLDLFELENIEIKTNFDLEIAHTDAGYYLLFHKMFIPGGILQLPYYNNSRPSYLNYGGIGFLLGHEIFHTIEFHEKNKEQCLISKFSHYRLSQINKTVNGTLTLRENYADNVGMRLAYNSYRVWRTQQSEEELRLVDFDNYTSEQMFWLSTAGIMCEYENDYNLKKTILKDGHSPGEARVNVGFANNLDFARDFNCPLGSVMNPKHKCL